MDREARALDLKVGPWLVLVSAVPVLLAVTILQLLGKPAAPLSDLQLAELGAKLGWSDFVPGLITYAAVVVAHICVCAVAIWVAVDMLRRSPDGALYGKWAAGMAGVVIAALLIGAGIEGAAAFQLTYHAIVDAFRSMGTGAPFAGAGHGLVSPLALIMFLPSALGIVAVAAMSAAANAQLRRFPPPLGETGEARAAYVGRVYARLRQC
ncbi:MAG: hypothetical protein ACREX8_21165, partial [Gammaproteobacteria bacterium]